jgi:deoxyribodipyrimidine photo-lyase
MPPQRIIAIPSTVELFPTHFDSVLERIRSLDVRTYAKTRNYLNGDVSRLSPYLSRGVISTKCVMEHVLSQGHPFYQVEKFIQELAWREYFQNVWSAKPEGIHQDLLQPQPQVENRKIPRAVVDATTGISAIDQGIHQLCETGYLHNHMRMYIASLVCNIGRSHWALPARWFYYHLLDADWASNACSWQWTAGAFSKKKYYANQENINRYSATEQIGTFLDTTYEALPDLPVPDVLKPLTDPNLRTDLPRPRSLAVDSSLPTAVYHFYNLDPLWKKNETMNRVLLLEPSHFNRFPVAPKSIEFALKLAQNIDKVQLFVGEFAELQKELGGSSVYFREHPVASHYVGIEEPREWMFPTVREFYPSFFNYWKKCRKTLELSQ